MSWRPPFPPRHPRPPGRPRRDRSDQLLLIINCAALQVLQAGLVDDDLGALPFHQDVLVLQVTLHLLNVKLVLEATASSALHHNSQCTSWPGNLFQSADSGVRYEKPILVSCNRLTHSSHLYNRSSGQPCANSDGCPPYCPHDSLVEVNQAIK